LEVQGHPGLHSETLSKKRKRKEGREKRAGKGKEERIAGGREKGGRKGERKFQCYPRSFHTNILFFKSSTIPKTY
jgi:flagellar biosynthesis/type III secretory pathway protein FliH